MPKYEMNGQRQITVRQALFGSLVLEAGNEEDVIELANELHQLGQLGWLNADNPSEAYAEWEPEVVDPGTPLTTLPMSLAPGQYLALQEQHLALQGRHIVLQDQHVALLERYLALQDQHEALLKVTTADVTPTVEEPSA